MTRHGLPHLMKAVKAVTCWELFLPLEQLGAIGSYCLPEDLHVCCNLLAELIKCMDMRSLLALQKNSLPFFEGCSLQFEHRKSTLVPIIDRFPRHSLQQ